MLLAVSTQTSIGLFVLFLSLVIAVVFGLVNLRQGRAEVGSEIELAANRKPYLPDAELEGRKLDRTLSFGLLGLFVVGIGLPLYWLQEPSRQEGAVERIREEFRNRGSNMYAPTADGGYNCAFCHGPDGGGGSTPFTITDAEGRFVKEVQWQGPALNTIFQRYSREEITFILQYGRLATPMPAWGTEGGGPLTSQQIQNLVDYIFEFQITPAEAQEAVAAELETAMKQKDPTCVTAATDAARAGLTEDELAEFDPAAVDVSTCAPRWKSEGEALFNLGYDSGFAGGAYSCGRCHTADWSIGEKGVDGGGALGPNLGGVLTQFPGDVLGVTQMTDFVCNGSTEGARYGQFGQGTGRMPGFCIVPAIEAAEGEVGIDTTEAGTVDQGGMYTQEQVQQVVEYVRSLAR
jgi:mono/diheme cytochrome c family protein